MEQWRTIKDYPNYSVSNYGRVRNDKRNKLMGFEIDKGGYARIRLCNCGHNKKFWVHRLVAQAFIPNPNEYPCVNHIDEDKQNNNVTNLQWCTHKQNNNYGTRNKRISEKLKISRKGCKPTFVKPVIVDDVLYESFAAASRDTGIPIHTLHRRKTEYKGHKIEHLNEYGNHNQEQLG